MRWHHHLRALQLSFMLEEAPTSGSVNSTAEEKQQLAAQSLDFNVSFMIRSHGGLHLLVPCTGQWKDPLCTCCAGGKSTVQKVVSWLG
jgi:hypothetical protein